MENPHAMTKMTKTTNAKQRVTIMSRTVNRSSIITSLHMITSMSRKNKSQVDYNVAPYDNNVSHSHMSKAEGTAHQNDTIFTNNATLKLKRIEILENDRNEQLAYVIIITDGNNCTDYKTLSNITENNFYISGTNNPTRTSTPLSRDDNDVIVISDDDEMIVIHDINNDAPIYEDHQVDPVHNSTTTHQSQMSTSSSYDIDSSLSSTSTDTKSRSFHSEYKYIILR